MDSDDLLGDDGRNALEACVKVQTMGRQEVQKYDRNAALKLLYGCYAGSVPKGLSTILSTWSFFDCPLTLYDVKRGQNVAKMKRKYEISEIYNALLRFDEMRYVEKYPREGRPDSTKLKQLIDQRRAGIEREIKEAKCDPDGRLKYSPIVAQRRVRNCFAGNFAGDAPIAALKEKIDEKYSIIDIHDAVACIDEKQLLIKYPEDNGPGSDELKNLICENRINLNKEYEKITGSGHATKHVWENNNSSLEDDGSLRLGRMSLKPQVDFPTKPPIQYEYSRGEAECRVRDCFAGPFPEDTNIFSTIKDQSEMDIFDIKEAVDRFDRKMLIDMYPEPGHEQEKKKNQVSENRYHIQNEYERATCKIEIEHGSGFIIHDYSIVTCKHAIETYLDDEEKNNIYISNASVGNKLLCTVAHLDATRDLALLYCPDLNLKKSGVHPLQLSDQMLLPGMSVMCFGYPICFPGETALFVDGKVSGSKKTLNGFPLVVLNSSLYSGNSGGPVLRSSNGQLKVVGLVKQKHIKDILTQEKLMTMLKKAEEKALTHEELAFDIYNALTTTHSPFNFADALPGYVVAEFLEDSKSKYVTMF